MNRSAESILLPEIIFFILVSACIMGENCKYNGKNNYNEEATILLSTHLIHDIENILDQVVFIRQGELVLNASVDEIRMQQGKSVDSLFREVFKC